MRHRFKGKRGSRLFDPKKACKESALGRDQLSIGRPRHGRPVTVTASAHIANLAPTNRPAARSDVNDARANDATTTLSPVHRSNAGEPHAREIEAIAI